MHRNAFHACCSWMNFLICSPSPLDQFVALFIEFRRFQLNCYSFLFRRRKGKPRKIRIECFIFVFDQLRIVLLRKFNWKFLNLVVARNVFLLFFHFNWSSSSVSAIELKFYVFSYQFGGFISRTQRENKEGMRSLTRFHHFNDCSLGFQHNATRIC